MTKVMREGRRKWEYLTENFIVSKPPHLTRFERLNQLGSEGWELVWTDGADEFIFKRPLLFSQCIDSD